MKFYIAQGIGFIGMALVFAAFQQNEKKKIIRLCSLPVSVLWLTYNVLSWSIADMLTEGFCLLSILIAIVRFDILRKKL